MQALWNEKFSRQGFLYGLEPNHFIASCIAMFPQGGQVLCLGEGEGRNAIHLAKEGFMVEALDASDVGLKKLQQRANEADLSIILRHTMLESWKAPYLYDVIVTSYLHLHHSKQRMLIEKSLKALKEGGLFVSEVFSTKQLAYTSGGPKDIDLLYDFAYLYSFLEELPCKILKISEEMVELNEGSGHQGEGCVIRIILEKISQS